MAKKKISYREAFDELQEIVEKLEDGEVEVDELAVLVERANFLTNYCKEQLTAVEEQVKKSIEEQE